MKYKHLFGPVASRRLGISLGIDLIPHKTCNFNCIYCECGENPPLFNERKEYVNVDEVLSELKDYLLENPRPDYITFSGSGEPTLNSGIGRLIVEIKKLTDIKVCVITNSSTLMYEDVRKELLNADLVMPSLNGVFEDSYLKINRPNVNLKLPEIIEGLKKFAIEFDGDIFLEIFMIDGINDSKEELLEFVKVIKELKVNKVQLNSLDRPAPVSWVKAMDMGKLEEIKEFFRSHGINTEIIKKYKSKGEYKTYSQNHEELILNLLNVRMTTFDEILEVTGLDKEVLGNYLDILVKEGIVKSKIENGKIYYRSF